jgi:hypothetical protein
MTVYDKRFVWNNFLIQDLVKVTGGPQRCVYVCLFVCVRICLSVRVLAFVTLC